MRKALIEKDYLPYDASLMLPYEDERLPYEQLIEILHAKFTKMNGNFFMHISLNLTRTEEKPLFLCQRDITKALLICTTK